MNCIRPSVDIGAYAAKGDVLAEKGGPEAIERKFSVVAIKKGDV